MNLHLMKPSDRFKRFQHDFNESLLTLDDSRLFSASKAVDPRRFGNIDLLTRTRVHQRLIEREKLLAAADIEIVFDESLDAFVWRTKPNNRLFVHSVEFDRQSEGHFDQKIENCVPVPEGGRRAIYYFIAKNRHSLPVIFVQNEKNSCFWGLARNTPRKPKSLGSCNTQTNAGRPAKIRITRSDFLSR